MAHANCSFIVSNYEVTGSEIADRIEPFKVFKKGPWKIGVFGLGIDFHKLVFESLHEKVTYLDPIEVSRSMVRILKSKGCDLIVCLSHLGYKHPGEKVSDRVLAASVEGIDLILGGHTHTALDQPEPIRNSAGETTLVAQHQCFGLRLGVIKVTRGPRLAKHFSSGFRSIA
jgi:5'-nucleotidase